MQLSGRQIQQIRDALLSGYPTRDELRAMVRIELDQNLEEIAGGDNLRVVVFNLVTWAERTGSVDALVKGAYNENRGNPALQQLAKVWQAQAASTPASGPTQETPDQAVLGPTSIDLFLSYSRKDADAMRQVQEVLRDAGLSVWTDDGLEPGTQSWQDSISEAVNQAKVMVVLLSPNANASTWVKREIGFAQSRGKRIFPLLIAGDEATAVPLSLIDAQRVDGRDDLRRAVAAQLLPALGIKQVAPARTDAELPVASQPQAAPATVRRSSYRGVLLTAAIALIVGILGFYLLEHYLFAAQPPAAQHTPAPAAVGLSKSTETPTEPTGAAKPAAGEVREIKGVPFVYVPAGEFKMGSDPAQDKKTQDSEKPQHVVTLPGFWIQRTEVTNEQYKRCVDAKACSPPNNNNSRWNDSSFATHPVTDVDWNQDSAYAKWFGGRLPTEAEWEKACRGTDGRIYPWGNQPPTAALANYGNNVGDTKPVGSYPEGASPYGALDMTGNVREWTSSEQKPYPYDANDGREDPITSGPRALRGGSQYDLDHDVRCAFRRDLNPDVTYNNVGFRVVTP